MGRPRTIRVQHFLRATNVAAILAMGAVGVIGHEWHLRAGRELLIHQKSELLADAVVATLHHSLTDDASNLDQTLARMLDIPDLLAISAYDAAGVQLAVSAKFTDADQTLKFDPDAAALHSLPLHASQTRLHAFERIEPPSSVAGVDTPVERMYVRTGTWLPHGVQYLGLLARMDPGRSAPGSWTPVLAILLCAAIVVFMIDRRLRTHLVDPLNALGRLAKPDPTPTQEGAALTPPGAGASAAPGAESAVSISELQAISEKLDALEQDARRWRQHAQIVERRADTHVARETTKIVRDLQRVQRESWTDALTGVRNRKFLEEKLPAIYKAQVDSRRDLSVIMIDLDNFKNINDTHGHGAGDEVLRFVGDLFQQCLRGDDLAIRYGGDEFIAILPGVSAENAVVLAERLLALFGQRARTMFKTDLPPTMTAGVASIDRNSTSSASELLACADHALLAAKQAGKRRARLATVRGDHFRKKGQPMRIVLRSSTPVSTHL